MEHYSRLIFVMTFADSLLTVKGKDVKVYLTSSTDVQFFLRNGLRIYTVKALDSWTIIITPQAWVPAHRARSKIVLKS